MKTIPLSEIIVPPNRQRRTFAADKLAEFADNIARTQLQNALVLRNGTLVSGERRLRAVTDLADQGCQIRHDGCLVPLGSIPYTDLSDLSPLAAREAELDENLHREDLSFQELAAAVAELHSLRTDQAAAAGRPAPSTADTALEVRGSSEGIHHETTRRQLIVARNLDNPAVKEAGTLDEAWKNLKRQEAATKARQLGESVGRVFTADAHRCINGDSLSWLASCPEAQFDVILTDPPYGMGADEFGDSGRMNMAAHSYKDDYETFERCLESAAKHFLRITKPQAHLYWFCDLDKFFTVRAAFSAAGWTPFHTPLIWHKPNGARAPWPTSGPHRKWECIFYAKKGDRPTRVLRSDVLTYSNEANQEHGAQKPVALFKDLLERSCLPGDAVLDPFCGTGPVFAAAHALKVSATGVEIDPTSYGISVKRIEGLKAQLELPV